MNAGAFGWPLNQDPLSTAPPNLIPKPNILMIMVDQLRLPQFWLTAAQQTTVDQQICPNITWLRKTSCRFWNFYVAAQACTPSRATLLTGLYAAQTGMFATAGKSEPDLNSGFPTFATALQDIAQYNPNNILWFGKWHLSNLSKGGNLGADKLPLYGFNTGRSAPPGQQIYWPSYYGSPNGTANEGNKRLAQ